MIFVDASAIVAILGRESEAELFLEVLLAADDRATSALAVYEAVLAVSRTTKLNLSTAEFIVGEFLAAARIDVLPIDPAHAGAALAAFALYGKGRGHPAQLNMGDCFAYAMAKSRDAALLFKGDDFVRTDIRAAVASS